MTMNETLAWYFARPDERLAYGDGREVAVGVVHAVEGTPQLCTHGLHGSINVLDALRYASSAILYRVKISGDIAVGDDKLCGSRREYLARYDVEDVLREFARKCAIPNIEKIKFYCSEEDYFLIIKWLETGEEELRLKAREAAWSATMEAAWSATRSATRSATMDAATWATARSAARSAAWEAARATARATAREAAREAAWAAAWAAVPKATAASAVPADAYHSAWAAADEMLIGMIEEKFGVIVAN